MVRESGPLRHARTIPFFSPEEAPSNAAGAEWREYAPGEVIFLEAEPAPGLFVLDSGYVKIVKASAQGREQSLEFIAPGQPFNTVAVFTSQPNPATAIALEASAAWMLPRATVSRLLHEAGFAERYREHWRTDGVLSGLVRTSLRTGEPRV